MLRCRGGVVFLFCILVISRNHTVFAETPSDSFESNLRIADSLLKVLIERPETRSKEVAPAESLYWKILSSHQELALIVRTNSKGIIVNSATTNENAKISGQNVAMEKWHALPQETMKPYFGPIVELNNGKRLLSYRSRPIIIKNSNGVLRFGGVIAVKILAESPARTSAIPQVKGQTQAFDSATKVRQSDTNKAPDAHVSEPIALKQDSAFEPVSVKNKSTPKTIAAFPIESSGKSSPKNGEPFAKNSPDIDTGNPMPLSSGRPAIVAWVLRITGLIVIAFAVVFGIIIPKRRRKKQENQAPENHVTIAGDPFQDMETSIGGRFEVDALETNNNQQSPEMISDDHVQTTAIPQSYDPVIHEETIGIIQTVTPGEAPAESDNALKNEIRAEITIDVKKELLDNELNSIRNSVITELKADIREKIENSEAEDIRTHIRQELTDAWRRNIQDSYQETFYRQELENLKKTIREKLIENEMPVLVKRHRTELSKEIRQKMVASFSDQIEQHERAVLKAEIVKKLQTNEYAQLLEEEREKFRVSIKMQIGEKEATTIETQVRDEFIAQLSAQVSSETDSIRNDIRKKIESELLEREHASILAECREALKEGIRREILEKESQVIRDGLVREVTQEQRLRVQSEDLPQVIESERNRIRDRESPALREQIRDTIMREELEKIRSELKKEIYAETIQGIQLKFEEEYKDLLEKETAQLTESLDGRARLEIKKNIFSEYQNLTEHLEGLSSTVNNVEALDSLSKTITLLCDEKKKYKYFNLNAAQTESLLEYLKRVHSRFNIFINKIDEAMLELKLKINSVMNTLEK